MKLLLCVGAGLFLAALVGGTGWAEAPVGLQKPSFDVVVYGASAAGVMTAVAAGREHLRVALVEPGLHVGGMVTGGLSGSDIANPDVIGGLAREFFDRMGTYYGTARYGHSTAWNFEPHVAETALRKMLKDAGVVLALDEPLLERGAVTREGKRLVRIRTRSREWTATVFVDGTYEGDLMAADGVSFTMGREGVKQYGEAMAGVRAETPLNQLPMGVKARDANGHLLQQINPAPLGTPGSADDKVSSFNFRLILSHDPANSLAFTKPTGYDPQAYALFAELWPLLESQERHAPTLDDVFRIVPIPNGKADFNNSGGFSTDFLNHSWEYLTLDAAGRKAVYDDHVRYTKGMFYFLANDPSVPRTVQDEMRSWGYAKDEFVDNGNWPSQLYIREGRRVVGDFVLTERDLISDTTKPDSIGMGSHNIDSHNVQRVATRAGFAQNEGDLEEHVQPYELPYRVLLPKAGEAENLLVPVCVSASHVAYSSLRMEPQYMILGQAAGEAAALAVEEHVPVQKIDVAKLQKRLQADGAILAYPIKTNYVVQ